MLLVSLLTPNVEREGKEEAWFCWTGNLTESLISVFENGDIFSIHHFIIVSNIRTHHPPYFGHDILALILKST